MYMAKGKQRPGYTTLSIKITTKAELTSICRKEQFYDDLILDLITERKKAIKEAK
jgi:hypothetical protein